MNFVNICESNNLSFTPIKYNKTGDKKYTLVDREHAKDWKSQGSIISMRYLLKFKDEMYDGYFIDLKKKFIVFDSDDLESYNYIVKLLKKNKCYNEDYITKSMSNVMNNAEGKYHFWFSIPEDPKFEIKQIVKVNKTNLDILTTHICEHKSSTITDKKIPLVPNSVLAEFFDEYETDDEESEDSDSESEQEENEEEKEKIEDILELLSDDRAENYQEWVKVGMILKGLDDDYIDIFDEFSKRGGSKYKGLKDIEKVWRTFKSKDELPEGSAGFGSLVHMAKEDANEKEIKAFYKKWNIKETTDKDFWDKLENLNQSDMAKMYYEMEKNKYVYSLITGWYEYNSNSILKHTKDAPKSLVSSISNKLQDIFIEKRNLVKPDHSSYDKKMKLFKAAYKAVGNSAFVKGMIDYLTHLYTVDRLDDKIDGSMDIIAFDNCVYDIKIKDFREILPSDYITKTTKYKINNKSNSEIRKKIKDLLNSIFNTEEMVNYWLKTTALSMFTNKYESLYIHTGKGGNGKGLLSSILHKTLGDYIYQADNTFFTSVFKPNAPNSTLAKTKGVRYLLVTEPDDGGNEAKLNVEFIKWITGGDIITTRDLFCSNISFHPQFTPFIQCNTKPKLSKMDQGIIRRIKVVNYPNSFVAEPKKPNERQININLKNEINNEFINEFMLLLLDIAKNNIDQPLVQPKDVLEETNEYFDANNPVKAWINERLEITNDSNKDRIKASTLFEEYNNSDYEKMSMTKFSTTLEQNGLNKVKNSVIFFVGIKLKEIKKEEQKSDLD